LVGELTWFNTMGCWGPETIKSLVEEFRDDAAHAVKRLGSVPASISDRPN